MSAKPRPPTGKISRVGSYRVVLETGSLDAVKAAVGAGLGAYNTKAAGPTDYAEFAVSVRDAKGSIRGGFTVEAYYETAFLRWAWIDEKLRGKALGRALMQAAEDEARRRGAKVMWLDTFSFQARPFYEKLGYKRFGTLAMGRKGMKRYFMSKAL